MKNILNFIKKKREERYTFRKIGSMLNISQQRVRQIYRNYKTINRKLRMEIIVRDNFTCQLCSSSRDKLEVHHIDGESTNNNENNLITLCRKCHTIMEKTLKNGRTDRKRDIIKKDLIKKRCLECNKEFSVIECRKNTAKYCSRKCFANNKRIYKNKKEKWRASGIRWYAKHKNDIGFKEEVKNKYKKYKKTLSTP